MRDSLERRGRSFARLLFVLACLTGLAGCGLQIYNFGGYGRGNDFYLPAGAAMNSDPVVQSWIAYSLSRSTCQLEIGGETPSSNTSFECELRSRRVLLDRWLERSDSTVQDDYLDLLGRVRAEQLLGDYVWVYLRERTWEEPDGLELERFAAWRSDNFPRALWHRPQTRIIGYWTELEPIKTPEPAVSPNEVRP